MPKRKDINKILIIGSGPIVISQAGEFDYSGTQACKALKEEGYKVVLVNSNPATIMTDTQFADATYIEPLNIHIIEKIIIEERPQALLPTLGGQTALNLAVELHERGILDKYNVELIGANISCIKKAEDRRLFKESMKKINVDVCKSEIVEDIDSGVEFVEKEICFPVIIRPSFTLGGSGGGIAYNKEELVRLLERGLEISPVHSVLVEESLIGWKEFELELMRDLADNVVIICSIENFDPMGIHTGDSITVAPVQTLTDKEYQRMRSTAIKIIREIGVETGGSNIQFAVNPDTGRMVAVEINPRVSRSSALASKATGFAIAKIAAKLAVGLRLDEIPNDITKKTPACFEPTIDYVVVKIPKFCFEKFEGACDTLGSEMKSVGEVMAIGRTFKEALQKAIRSLEMDKSPFSNNVDIPHIKNKLITPNPERLFYIIYALQNNVAVDDIYKWTKIDKWFLHNIKEMVDVKEEIKKSKIMEKETILSLKKLGFLDMEVAEIFNITPQQVYDFRKKHNILPTYKVIDTCAAEFESYTPYLYSSYETEDEMPIDSCDNKKKVVILGSGPNRIGQGIEFDYCCCHAVFSLKEEGYQTIMINSNPETVSTDYDTACKLYFEPLTEEDVLNVIERERPVGVILQFGGQKPLKLAIPLKKRGVKILGTQPESIDLAEDRDKFSMLLKKLSINQAPYGCVEDCESAIKVANKLGYPVLLRPSYVLGGSAMAIVYDDDSLAKYIKEAIELSFKHPLLIDKFLEDAIEVDVDAVSDAKEVIIAGIMEHIEEAGIHSGDSACVLPPKSLSKDIINVIKDYTRNISLALGVVGLINIQYAIKDGVVYVLEANPRASRTVPFVSKATGVAWAKIAAKLAIGKSIKELNIKERNTDYVSVKESVLPFMKFPEVDPVLGPQMRSTGEVMGIDSNFGLSYAKAQMSVKEQVLPLSGCAFLSVRDKYKQSIIEIAKELKELGFKLLATEGTAFVLNSCGLQTEVVYKVGEGRPNVVDYIKNNKIQLIINTPMGKFSRYDEAAIRKSAVRYKVPYITTIQASRAAVAAISSLKTNQINVMSLQERWNLRS